VRGPILPQDDRGRKSSASDLSRVWLHAACAADRLRRREAANNARWGIASQFPRYGGFRSLKRPGDGADRAAGRPHDGDLISFLVQLASQPGYLRLNQDTPVVASVLRNPKVTVITDDGRRWLRLNPGRQFDAIVSNTTFYFRANV